MSVHEQFGEDLALYALGTLPTEDRAKLETHLQSCADCRSELEMLRGDMALLGLSTVGSKPPARARSRLLNAVNNAQTPRVARRAAWWRPVRWGAAFALVVLSILLVFQNDKLEQQVSQLQKHSSKQEIELQRARDIVSTLTATDALRVTLVSAKTPPQPQGKAIYVRDRSSLIFLASNMPKLPTQKTYELWLIPTHGNPIPAGTFTPDARGSATVINPPLPAQTEAKAFAITIEPEQGSLVPTMPIMMQGSGE